jgi:hypothetical protein
MKNNMETEKRRVCLLMYIEEEVGTWLIENFGTSSCDPTTQFIPVGGGCCLMAMAPMFRSSAQRWPDDL